MDYEKEIPFGAFDSELMHQEINIPEGFEATIEGNKIILKKTESEDEKVREYLIRYIDNTMKSSELKSKILAWLKNIPYTIDHEKREGFHLGYKAALEKQGEKQQKIQIWKHWKDGIMGNGEGKPVYLTKCGRIYSLSSCLCFECDYIKLSELDKLLSEKQGERKPQRIISAEAKESLLHDKYEGLTDFERTLTDICIGWIGEELGWKQYIKDNADVLLKIAIEKFNSVQDASFEQKTAWSEEDQNAFEDVREAIVNCWGGDTQDTLLCWLKSLKQRMGE